MQAFKELVNDLTNLEKQYSLLIFLAILWGVKRVSNDAFNGVISKVADIFNIHFPKASIALINIFDNQFIYSLTKLLIMVSGISSILFVVFIFIQIGYNEYFNGNVSLSGRQYTADLFIGKFGVVPFNIYLFIMLFILVFSNNKTIKLYVPDGILGYIGIALPGMFSILALTGLFTYGKPKENEK